MASQLPATCCQRSSNCSAGSLSHGAIPTLKWGPMTMDFKLPPDGSAPKVQVGDRVSFEFFMGADDLPQLTRVTPMAAGGKP